MDTIWLLLFIGYAIGLIPIAYFGIVGTNEAIDFQNRMAKLERERNDKNWCSYYFCFLYYLYVCNGGICMSKEIKKEQGYTTYELFKIFDKLEQRIASLEKVLESHAKCIGEIREDKNEQS